jgi:tetratricopeptide (TPR) repeat protein
LEEEGQNVDGAVVILEQAVGRFPEEEKLLYYLGSLYDRRGDTDKSLEQMERILRVNPKNADAMNYIGYTWTLRGVRMQDAGRLLKKAVTLKPDNGYIQDSWGWYLFVNGRLDEAVVQLEKANQLKPNEPTIMEHLADAYAKANLLEKALSRYQEAEKLTADPEAKRKLASKIESLSQQLVEAGRAKGGPSRLPASTQPAPIQSASQ